MEKAKSMRLQACLPQSWWEFALDHATHVYNRTPIRRLSWLTPYTMLTGDKPSIDHLRVFGSGAYVFIPAEVRANKLSPKSELMVYLGTAPGGKGWIFMRGPNNVIFTAANATFDESLFPRCPKQVGVRKNIKLQTSAPKPKQCSGEDCHCPFPMSDEEQEEEQPVPLPVDKGKSKETWVQARQREIEERIRRIPIPSEAPPITMPPRREGPLAPRQVVPIPLQPEQRRSGRARKVPVKLGNVYGNKHPVEIEKEIRSKRTWSRVVGEHSSRPRPGAPGRTGPPPELTEEEPEAGPSSIHDSEDDVEDSLQPSSSSDDDHVAKLCREGGAALSHFLIFKAITPNAPEKSPKEWTFRDLANLPKESLVEWKAACEKELDTLNRRKVFELIKRP